MTQLSEKILRHKNKFALALVAIVTIFAATVLLDTHQLRSSVVDGADSPAIASIDRLTYQVLQFDTTQGHLGNTIFGKVIESNNKSVTVENVFYYLGESKSTLVKKAKDPDTGKDTLTFDREDISAIENLDKEGPFFQAIQHYFQEKNS